MFWPRPARSSSEISACAELMAAAAGLHSGISAWTVPYAKWAFCLAVSVLSKAWFIG